MLRLVLSWAVRGPSRRDVSPWHERTGGVAQLGERCVRNAEVEGSTPFASTG